MGWVINWTERSWTTSWATSFDPSDENGVDPNAWQDELGNAMTDELGNPIIFNP